MDNFNLKKFLVENKLTSNSRVVEKKVTSYLKLEEIEDVSDIVREGLHKVVHSIKWHKEDEDYRNRYIENTQLEYDEEEGYDFDYDDVVDYFREELTTVAQNLLENNLPDLEEFTNEDLKYSYNLLEEEVNTQGNSSHGHSFIKKVVLSFISNTIVVEMEDRDIF